MLGFAVSIGALTTLGIWCILRVRGEYLRQDRLSPASAVAVWALYAAHFGLTAAAAAGSRWPLPVSPLAAFAGGTVLLTAGTALFAGGVVSFGSLRRMSGIDTSRLVTSGAYRWSRNPQNVGWALFLLGMALLGRSALALLLAAAFWATFRAYLGAEEQFLERVFGDRYREYRLRSHRYLGRPRSPAG